MKINREILRVKSMLERATEAEEIARLTSLLVTLQADYITYLEHKMVTDNRKIRNLQKVIKHTVGTP